MAIDSFKGEYRWLSNFEKSPLEFDGEVYATAEHLYQALKTKNPDERRKIRECDTPGKARRLGQEVSIPENWNDIRGDVMEVVLRLKFPADKDHPNYKFTQKLLDTEAEELIEGNTWGDVYFGVCNGEGQNILGKLLMKIRGQRSRDL